MYSSSATIGVRDSSYIPTPAQAQESIQTAKRIGIGVLRAAVSVTPLGDFNDAIAVVTGHDILYNETLSAGGRVLAAAGIGIGSGKAARVAADLAGEAVQIAVKNIDGVVDAAKAAGNVGTQTAKTSGAYFLKFEDGFMYAGKGPLSRMNESIRRIEGQGYKLLEGGAEHFPTATAREGFIKEFQLMKETGQLPRNIDPNSLLLNKIWSPGKKLLGE